MPPALQQFVYSGPAFRQPGNEPVTVKRQTFTVIEFCPYEPSAYVHSPCFLVEGKGGMEYAIDVYDLDEFEGRCGDCQQRHGKGDCHYDQPEPSITQ